MNQSMIGHDVYFKYTEKGGHSFVAHHRAWDSERLLQSKQQEAAKTGGRVELAERPPLRRRA
jgi:hypothetical protein